MNDTEKELVDKLFDIAVRNSHAEDLRELQVISACLNNEQKKPNPWHSFREEDDYE